MQIEVKDLGLFGNVIDEEALILRPPDAKNWLIGKDPDAGRDWGQEEKGMTEDEMVGWHHWLDGHEFERAAGVGDGQGSLACCSPRGRKESNTTERLNWTVDEKSEAYELIGKIFTFLAALIQNPDIYEDALEGFPGNGLWTG